MKSRGSHLKAGEPEPIPEQVLAENPPMFYLRGEGKISFKSKGNGIRKRQRRRRPAPKKKWGLEPREWEGRRKGNKWRRILLKSFKDDHFFFALNRPGAPPNSTAG